MDKVCSICCNKGSKLKIKVVGKKGVCKYHDIGQEFSMDEFVHGDFCWHAFHAIYPYALALTYDAEFTWMKEIDPEQVIAQCPSVSNTVIIQARRRRLDERLRKVDLEIVEVKGECPYGMKKGQKFEFNLGDFRGICPAGFNSLYPFLLSFLQDEKISQCSEPFVVRCPDHLNLIDYEITKEEK